MLRCYTAPESRQHRTLWRTCCMGAGSSRAHLLAANTTLRRVRGHVPLLHVYALLERERHLLSGVVRRCVVLCLLVCWLLLLSFSRHLLRGNARDESMGRVAPGSREQTSAARRRGAHEWVRAQPLAVEKTGVNKWPSMTPPAAKNTQIPLGVGYWY